MGGFANFGGYDDGLTGDGLGSGIADSQTGWDGIDQVDNPDPGTAEPGSSVQLDTTGGIADDLAISDLYNGHTALDSVNLAGNTETAPNPSSTYGVSDNGAGAAAHNLSGTTPSVGAPQVNMMLNALGKFGTGIASLVTGNRAAVVNGQPIGAAGSRLIVPRPPTSISKSNFTLILVVVGVVIIGLAFSD